jgi:type I restriction enzyme R subunit
MFRVYDYTNATRLMGKEFNIRHFPSKEREGPVEPPIEKVIRVEGFEVHVNPAGTYIVTKKDEKLTMVSVEEYKQIVAEHLVQEVNTINDFREIWIKPQERINLINALPNNGQGMRMLREVLHRNEYDYYDVLAEIGYGIDPKTRRERVEALHYKHDAWLKHLPEKTAQALLALARQFEIDGTDGLENPHIFEAPEVIKSGGIQSLKLFGKPEEIIEETKRRLLAA